MATEIRESSMASWPAQEPLMQLELYEIRELVDKRFLGEAHRRGYPAALTEEWRCDVAKPPAPRNAVRMLAVCPNLHRRRWDALYESRECLFWASWANGRVAVDIAGPSPEACAQALMDAKDVLPVSVDADDGQIAATIWVRRKEQGARTLERRLEVPRWPHIAGNYSAATRGELDGLMKLERPSSGKLLLWNGPAGTGKTYALRALAQAWSPWCELHYVSDPEALLGSETRVPHGRHPSGTRRAGRR
jgi:hypothetical protein